MHSCSASFGNSVLTVAHQYVNKCGCGKATSSVAYDEIYNFGGGGNVNPELLSSEALKVYHSNCRHRPHHLSPSCGHTPYHTHIS